MLGIVGLIADMTIPTLVGKIEQTVLKTQFKKTYSFLSQVVLTTKTQFGYDTQCFYWETNPYGGATCDATDEYGDCTHWNLGGQPLPGDYNGKLTECPAFWTQMVKNMKVAKYCASKAYEGGCAPFYKSGKDTINEGANPNGYYSTSNMNNNMAMYVLADGMILMPYANNFGMPIVAIDINGKKGPNKWGHDIFNLEIHGTPQGRLKIGCRNGSSIVDKGGKTTIQMINDMFK